MNWKYELFVLIITTKVRLESCYPSDAWSKLAKPPRCWVSDYLTRKKRKPVIPETCLFWEHSAGCVLANWPAPAFSHWSSFHSGLQIKWHFFAYLVYGCTRFCTQWMTAMAADYGQHSSDDSFNNRCLKKSILPRPPQFQYCLFVQLVSEFIVSWA